jgi:hypothetical protein
MPGTHLSVAFTRNTTSETAPRFEDATYAQPTLGAAAIREGQESRDLT